MNRISLYRRPWNFSGYMRNAADSGIEYLQMEVSSQALKYNRVDEVRLDAGGI